MHPNIIMSHMRLALALREALSDADHDKVVGDAKELILAARKIAGPARDVDAILDHLTDLLLPYSLRPVLFEGALALKSDNGYLRAVPL